jgi:hypothetical protein
MLNVPLLRNGTMHDSMTARELLAKATVVFHSYIKERSVINSCERWCLSPCELSKTITESLDALRVLVYALVKEYAKPYETLREQAAVCDFLPRALTVIAMEKPSKVVCSRSHTTLEEATERVKWCFPDRESCSRPCLRITRGCTQ